MPKENDTKPCTNLACGGTMSYWLNAPPVGNPGRLETPEARKLREEGLAHNPGWLCDRNLSHFQPEL